MKMLEDVQQELELFFDDLNWTYIFMYVIILYGIKHKDEFAWYNYILRKKPLSDFKSWIAGITTGLFFCYFHWAEVGKLEAIYVSQMLRSFVIVIVFNTVFTKKIEKIEDDNS